MLVWKTIYVGSAKDFTKDIVVEEIEMEDTQPGSLHFDFNGAYVDFR